MVEESASSSVGTAAVAYWNSYLDCTLYEVDRVSQTEPESLLKNEKKSNQESDFFLSRWRHTQPFL